MRIRRIFTLLAAAFAISVTTISAQPGGGMGGPHGGGMGPGGPMMRSGGGDPVAMTGYFEMDAEKAIKKIKVKDGAEVKQIREAFASFAVGSAEVYSSHPDEFADLDELKEIMKSAQFGDMSEGDRKAMRAKMMSTRVIKSEMVTLHKALQADMQRILAGNERSLGRWDIYYEYICNSKSFSEKERERGGQGGGQGGGMRGPGMGGPGMGGPGMGGPGF